MPSTNGPDKSSQPGHHGKLPPEGSSFIRRFKKLDIETGLDIDDARLFVAHRSGIYRVPNGFWNNEDTVRSITAAALETVADFKAAMDRDDGPGMAEAVRKHVIAYKLKVKSPHKLGGMQAFFTEVGGLQSAMKVRRDFLGEKINNPGALLHLAFPQIIDDEKPGLLRPWEIEHEFWTDKKAAQSIYFKVMDGSVPGFKAARACIPMDIKSLAAAYRKTVIGYKGSGRDKEGGQLKFLEQFPSMVSMMIANISCLDARYSAAAMLRAFLPGIIDRENPDALRPWEVEDGYWEAAGNLEFHFFKALKTVKGFMKAFKGHEVGVMTGLYRRSVIGYKASDKTKFKGGQRAFFYEKGEMGSWFESRKGKFADLVTKFLPGLVNLDNPVALWPHEVESPYWTSEFRIKAYALKALFTLSGFEAEHTRNDLDGMARIFIKNVIEGYESPSGKGGGAKLFFYEVGKLEGGMSANLPCITKKGSPNVVLDIAVPGLVEKLHELGY